MQSTPIIYRAYPTPPELHPCNITALIYRDILKQFPTLVVPMSSIFRTELYLPAGGFSVCLMRIDKEASSISGISGEKYLRLSKAPSVQRNIGGLACPSACPLIDPSPARVMIKSGISTGIPQKQLSDPGLQSPEWIYSSC